MSEKVLYNMYEGYGIALGRDRKVYALG